MSRRHFNHIDEIVAEVKRTGSAQKAARRLRCSVQTVYARLKEEGIEVTSLTGNAPNPRRIRPMADQVEAKTPENPNADREFSAVVTQEEKDVVDWLAEAWNAYMELPTEHPMDQADFCRGINKLQDMVLARAGRRAINPQRT